jgi:MFS family permease
LLGFVTNVWWFVAVLVVWAIPGAILLPTMNALIAERAPEDQRGAVLGFADSLNNASMIVAPAAGAAVVSANVHWVGLLPAACALTAIVLGLTGGAKRPAASAARSASA